MKKACLWISVLTFCGSAAALLLFGCGGGGGGGGGDAQPVTLSGRIVDAADPGVPVPGARVSVYPMQRTAAPAATAQADGSGWFQCRVAPGDYQLEIEREDASYQKARAHIRLKTSADMTVRMVPASLQIARVELTAPPGDGIDGGYLAGQSYQFGAVALDASGKELSIAPNWCVTGCDGTISSEGVFTPSGPGAGKITVLFTAVDQAEKAVVVTAQAQTLRTFTVLGWNDLGMHCMNQDFSELAVLPPYNTLHAQVIDRSGEDPRIVTGGITVKYLLPANTRSANKTNFWQYARPLFGVTLAANIGLTGNGLSGTMKPTGTNDWNVTGIPITPIDDTGHENPYGLATVTAYRNNQVMGQTQAVVPVSWEMNCNLCHRTAGISTATDILRAHDRLHKTTLEKQKPVLCASCHPDNALGAPGKAGVSSLSHAMHRAHAPRMAQAQLEETCYACHPGVRTQCLRDVHYVKGFRCERCHGDMKAVSSTARRPWIDEPRCGSAQCHHAAAKAYEQAGTLYRNAKGHHGIRCPACHGSPHAITPTVKAADNVQAIALQGQAGAIKQCTVCHRQKPDDPFDHRYEGGSED